MTSATCTRLALLCGWTSLAGSTSLAAQTIKLDVVGNIPGPADFVRVSGTYAYVSAGDTLRVVDISEPSAPKPRGIVQLPAGAAAIAVSGSAVYATMGLRGLAVVDVSNADAPAVVGFYKTAGEALRIAVAGTRVVLTDRMAGADVIDISDRAKPASVGAYYTEGYTRDVAIVGSLAYVVDSTNDFAIVDLSRAGEPRALSTLPSSLTSTLVAVSSSAMAPKTAYVVGGGSLQVYDVSNPVAPRKLVVTKIHERTTALAVDGGFGYAAVGTEGLQVLDLSDPGNPVQAGSYKPAGNARDVAVSGDLILVAVNSAARPAAGGSAPAAGVVILRRSR